MSANTVTLSANLCKSKNKGWEWAGWVVDRPTKQGQYIVSSRT